MGKPGSAGPVWSLDSLSLFGVPQSLIADSRVLTECLHRPKFLQTFDKAPDTPDTPDTCSLQRGQLVPSTSEAQRNNTKKQMPGMHTLVRGSIRL